MQNQINLLRQPIIIATWIFFLIFILLKFGPSLPLSVLTQARGEPFIVSETGEATAVPDSAQISFGISEQNTDLLSAQNSANKKSNSLVSSLKNLGIEEKDIKTTSYNVQPNYDFRSGSQAITGYTVSINYQVKIRELDKINQALSTATSAGASNISGVSITFSDELRDKLLGDARKEAIEKAKNKAESLASLAGLSLGRIINVSEGYAATPQPLRAQTLEAGSADLVQADIQPGESNVNVTVSISWEVR
jgi:hypothetical protein